jgi:hypothetical protein
MSGGRCQQTRDAVGMEQIVGVHDGDPIAARRVEPEVASRTGAGRSLRNSRARGSCAADRLRDGGAPSVEASSQSRSSRFPWLCARTEARRRAGRARRCGRPSRRKRAAGIARWTMSDKGYSPTILGHRRTDGGTGPPPRLNRSCTISHRFFCAAANMGGRRRPLAPAPRCPFVAAFPGPCGR